MDLSKELWDGFDKIGARLDIQLAASHDYLAIITRRAKAEQDYGRILFDSTKVIPGNPKAPAVKKLETTIQDAFISVSESQNKVGERHLEVSKKITEETIKPLDACIRKVELEKRKVIADGDRKLKSVQESLLTAKRSHDIAEKAKKDADTAHSAYVKAKSDADAAPDNKRLAALVPKAEAIMKKAVERVKQTDEAYKKAVDNANELQNKVYDEEMPKYFGELESLITELYETTAAAMEAYANAFECVPEEVIAESVMVKEAFTNELSKEGDMEEFVNANKSDADRPQLLEYTPFVADYDDI